MISSTSTVSSPRCKRTAGTIKGTVNAAEDTRSAEEIAKEVFRSLPQKPPERVRVKAEGSLKDETFLVIRATGRKDTLIHCTGCEREFTMPRVTRYRSTGWGCQKEKLIGFRAEYPEDETYNGREFYTGDRAMCPYCEEAATVIHVSDISTYGKLVSRDLVGTSIPVSGAAVTASWYRSRFLFKNGLIVTEWNEGYASALFRRGKKWSFVEAPGVCNNMGGLLCYGYFRPRKRARYDFPNADLWIPSEKGAFDGTDTERARLGEYERQNDKQGIPFPDTYLRMWSKHPNVETIVQSGGARILHEILGLDLEYRTNGYTERLVRGTDVRLWINTKLRKPHGMLGITKEQYRELAGIGKNRGANEVLIYLTCAKAGITLTKEELRELMMTDIWGYNDARFRAVREILEVNPEFLKHAIRYLRGQVQKKIRATAWELLDYWRMLEERLGEGKTPDHGERWPSDLSKAHDRESEFATARRQEGTNKGIIRAYRQNLPYSFTDKETGLLIRPVSSVYELTKEGATLHHCVASYAGKVSKGETEIFLIRKIGNAKKPFFTLEYRDGRVIQNRGLKNCPRTEQVVKFEEKWLEYLKTHQKQIKERIKQVTTNV